MRGALLLAAFAAACAAHAADAPPATRVEPVVDTHHGVAVADPYRWLEGTADAATLAWFHAQDAYARATLAALPGHAALRARLAAAFAAHSAATLERELAAARVPAARVRSLSEFMREWSAGTMATAPVTRVDYPGGTVLDAGTGAKWDRRAPNPPRRAPRLGEHTADLVARERGPDAP